jgi:hypothetical protein
MRIRNTGQSDHVVCTVQCSYVHVKWEFLENQQFQFYMEKGGKQRCFFKYHFMCAVKVKNKKSPLYFIVLFRLSRSRKTWTYSAKASSCSSTTSSWSRGQNWIRQLILISWRGESNWLSERSPWLLPSWDYNNTAVILKSWHPKFLFFT